MNILFLTENFPPETNAAATTSGLGSESPAQKPVTMKLRKSRVRRRTPRLGAMKVFTLTTRIPSISSACRQRFR